MLLPGSQHTAPTTPTRTCSPDSSVNLRGPCIPSRLDSLRWVGTARTLGFSSHTEILPLPTHRPRST
eukprot:1142730-Rhodomonas_salina.2